MIMFPADKTSPSRHDRTPSHSPSRNPHPKGILWTPPTKVITNPRLNQISSPVGMVSSNPQSPLNKTPPKTQSLQSLSPKVSTSPTNLKTGITYTLLWCYRQTSLFPGHWHTPPFIFSGLSTQVAPNKLSNLSPASTSVSLPLSPRGEVSEASKPRLPADAKFQGPKQLLTSWLRTNSRKRTHGDSNKKTNPEITSLASEPSSELTFKFKSTSQNVEQLSLISLNNQTEEHGTKDTKENYLNGQKSPSVSPLKKRLCVNTSLNLSSHSQESKHVKLNLNPGKENLTVDSSYCPPGEVKQADKKSDAKCKETSITTSNQNITTKSKSQVSTTARTLNWLTEWSIYCKTKYGDKSVSLPGSGGESTAAETPVATNVTAEDSLADDLQPLSTQVSSDLCLCTCSLKNNRCTLSQ